MDVDIEFMPYRVHYTNKSCIKWHETVWSCFRGNPFLIINRQKYKEWQVVQIKEVSEPRTHDTHDTHDVLLVNKRESLEGQSDGVVFKLHLLCDGKQIPDHHNNSRCFSFYSSGVDFIIGGYLKWTHVLNVLPWWSLRTKCIILICASKRPSRCNCCERAVLQRFKYHLLLSRWRGNVALTGDINNLELPWQLVTQSLLAKGPNKSRPWKWLAQHMSYGVCQQRDDWK